MRNLNLCSDWFEQAYISNMKKYEVGTSLYGLNKTNKCVTSDVLMNGDCNGGKDDCSQ